MAGSGPGVAEVRGEQYLTKRAQFDRVYAGGGSWPGRVLVLRAMPNGLGLSRYGFSVSRRVGAAVVRNRVKRRLREILRHAELRPGWDIVLLARAPAAGAGYAGLERAAVELLSRAGLLTGGYEGFCPGVN